MILHGDEMGRTQRGNNNVYCQDNELSWIDWTPDDRCGQLLAFSQQVLRLRRDHPVFRRRRFFKGAAYQGGQSDVGDIAWFTPAARRCSSRTGRTATPARSRSSSTASGSWSRTSAGSRSSTTPSS